MYSKGEMPSSSAAASANTLNVEPACMPMVPPMSRPTL